MRFPIFLDTNVLYPLSLADTVLRLGEAEVCRLHWSPHVMEELKGNLAQGGWSRTCSETVPRHESGVS